MTMYRMYKLPILHTSGIFACFLTAELT